VTLTHYLLAAGLVAGIVLQIVGVLYVRKFATALWAREAWVEKEKNEMLQREGVEVESASFDVERAPFTAKLPWSGNGSEKIDEEAEIS
jgi:hypothetical protein